MKLTHIGQYHSCVLNEDGYINYPYSHFLNQKSNKDTRQVEFKALRILNKYLSAHNIDFSTKILDENILLNANQATELRNLCWLPIQKIESCSNAVLRRLFKATTKSTRPEDRPNSVKRNTAAQRAETIARFIEHYEIHFVPQLINSQQSRSLVKENVRLIRSLIKNIKSEDNNHHGQIKSLPTSKFLDVIKIVLQSPEKIFITSSGLISRTLIRDQCIFLMACEGLRPGAIASISLGHYEKDSGFLDLSAAPISSVGPKSKGANSSIKIYTQPRLIVYPFTQKLINKYLNTERASILRKFAVNPSGGRLFITERGKPIASSTTMKNIFSQASKSFERMGILKIENDPHMRRFKAGKDCYEFYAYVLRHSAATFFLAINGLDEANLQAMKPRFGWSRNSKQPERYAKREFIDLSNATLHDHMQNLEDLAQREFK